MTQTRYDQIAAVIRDGYGNGPRGEEGRNLAFIADALPIPSAIQVGMDAVGPYNAFEPEEVKHALRLLAMQCPSCTVRIGREGSPVLFLLGTSLSQVQESFRHAHYDECSEISPSCIRLWWD